MGGAYHSSEDDANKTYYRVMKNLNPAEAADKQKVAEMLGQGAFRGLALRAVVDGDEPTADTAAGAWLAELRENGQLHWAAK